MIISRTPFRISFFGGGTDYPVWYRENGGAVLSTTIDKYSYLNCRYLPPFFDNKYKVVWSKIEAVKNIDEIEHPVVREVLKFLNISDGMEIHNSADLPAWSGMGSSSSFAVGLLNALHTLKGHLPSKEQLASEAIHIERNVLKEDGGIQDQIAAAFGGFNKIVFGGEKEFEVTPLPLHRQRIEELQSHLMLFFTGTTKMGLKVAAEQIKNTPKKSTELQKMASLVTDAEKILFKNDGIEDFGHLLDETWKLKRTLTGLISNSKIDEIYDKGIRAGALGGKLLGAGGRGFILFFVKPEFQDKVREALSDLVHVPFKFENSGSQIIHYQPK
ncbi:kinase [Patescibacteria group bacterium]|nr:kinase [Patescibacteria group bacterium]